MTFCICSVTQYDWEPGYCMFSFLWIFHQACIFSCPSLQPKLNFLLWCSFLCYGSLVNDKVEDFKGIFVIFKSSRLLIVLTQVHSFLFENIEHFSYMVTVLSHQTTWQEVLRHLMFYGTTCNGWSCSGTPVNVRAKFNVQTLFKSSWNVCVSCL